jgi:hypothetical protein
MPTMAAITVKKRDGTTDIVYDIKSASAGDGTWASWRQDTANTNPYAARPTLLSRVSESGKGIRRVDVVYNYPYYYTDSTTSQVVVSPLAVSFKNGVMTVPQGIPTTFIEEASYQFSNLMNSTQLKLGLSTQTPFT